MPESFQASKKELIETWNTLITIQRNYHAQAEHGSYRHVFHIDPYSVYSHKDGPLATARKWALSLHDFSKTPLYSSFDRRFSAHWLPGGIARMHPIMANKHHNPNFEYQLGQHLDSSLVPQTQNNAPSHLTNVTHVFRNDLVYNKSVRKLAAAIAVQTQNVLPYSHNILPPVRKRQRSDF
jgi:hypothetical protein